MATDRGRTIDTATVKHRARNVKIYGVSNEYIFSLIKRDSRFYEDDLLDLLASVESKGRLIVDVGANLGNHTLHLALAHSDSTVVAVEPIRQNLLLLEKNIDANHLSRQVEVHRCALSDVSGAASMVTDDANNLGSSHIESIVDGAAGSLATENVEVRTLDEVTAGRATAIIKVDVEGHEAAVLRGGISTLRESLPVVVTEAHDPQATREIEQILVPLGYRAVALRGRSKNFIWIANGGIFGPEESEEIAARISIETADRARRQIVHAIDRLENHLSNKFTTTQASVTDRILEIVQERMGSEDRSVRANLNEISERVARAESVVMDQVIATSATQQVETQGKLDSLHKEIARMRDELAQAMRGANERIANEGRSTAQLESLVTQGFAELRSAASETATHAEDAQRWRNAYEQLSSLTSQLAPEVWTHIGDSVGEDRARAGGPDAKRDVTPVVARDRVRVGIATIPGREAGLRTVLDALSPQADEVYVYLNGYATVPSSMPHYENVHFFTGPDLGDRGKFEFLEGFDGYYLTCDDDIAYPRFYVDHIIAGIERFDRKAIVGWHGSVFNEPFENYYDPKYRRVFAFYSHRPGDTPVHLVGTGVSGFHTSSLEFRSEDLPIANMADVWLSIAARQQGVPMYVLAHEKGWATPLDKDAPSISNSSIGKAGATSLDMREVVTHEIASRAPWPALAGPEARERAGVRLAIIGRTDRERWKKGGILKSCHLMAETLRRFGAETELTDVVTGDPIGLGGFDANIVMIYVGDPDRPDYANVASYIEHHARLGRKLVVNMSLEGHQQRTEWIRDELMRWEDQFPGQVFAMVFTNAARSLPEFASVRDRIVVIPKTIEELSPLGVTYEQTEGVFVGDIAKLVNPKVVGGEVQPWISAIRSGAPAAPIYAVQQYKPNFDTKLDIDQVWPFMKSDMSSKMASVRMMVSLAKNLTFEMVPIEVASLGVPVIHRHMPYSLSEYFGVSALEVGSPAELEALIGEVYSNRSVWRSFSQAGRRRAHSLDLGSTAGNFYVQLLRIARA